MTSAAISFSPPGFSAPSSRPHADALLARIFKEGDTRAYEALFNLYYKPLCRYCRKFVDSMEVAEEVVGDVFFAIWKNRQKYEIQSSGLSYLFTATRNRAYDYLRRGQRDRTVALEEAREAEDAAPSTQLMMEADEVQIRLRTAIESLPPSCRQIFCLSRDEGMKYHEIADHLNLSVKTVETQMGRALRQIRQHFTPVASLPVV